MRSLCCVEASSPPPDPIIVIVIFILYSPLNEIGKKNLLDSGERERNGQKYLQQRQKILENNIKKEYSKNENKELLE
jgi:hypothetical protein